MMAAKELTVSDEATSGQQVRSNDSLGALREVDSALELADYWAHGITPSLVGARHGWRPTCKLLADEVRRLRNEIELLCNVIDGHQVPVAVESAAAGARVYAIGARRE